MEKPNGREPSLQQPKDYTPMLGGDRRIERPEQEPTIIDPNCRIGGSPLGLHEYGATFNGVGLERVVISTDGGENWVEFPEIHVGQFITPEQQERIRSEMDRLAVAFGLLGESVRMIAESFVAAFHPAAEAVYRALRLAEQGDQTAVQIVKITMPSQSQLQRVMRTRVRLESQQTPINNRDFNRLMFYRPRQSGRSRR